MAGAPAEAAVSAEADVPVEADVPAADPSGPVDAPAVQDAEMSDPEYLPQSGVESDDSTSMDEVAASGDDEVVAAAPLSSLSDSPRLRRKRRRRTVSPAVPSVVVDMDTSVDEVPGHSYFRTFRGVWDDRFSWEIYRSRKPRCKRVETPKPEPPSSPVLFRSQDLSASSATPVPPATPVPSSVSSDGSVVDSVKSPSPGRRRFLYQYGGKGLW